MTKSFQAIAGLTMVGLLSCSNPVRNRETVSLVINEYMVNNHASSGIIDSDGKASDWVELYNAGTTTVNLRDYYLTDNLDKPAQGLLPDQLIKPGECMLFWGGKSDNSPQNHLGFSFSKDTASGEIIALFDRTITLVDSVLINEEATKKNRVIGRLPDGALRWSNQNRPSPGSHNNG